MAPTQTEKALAFRALHQRAGAFVIPNPWDAGSTLLLANLGFEALATTSAGFAFTLGRRDGEGAVSRDEMLANAKAIVEATDLPVSADLENCFADAPEEAAETLRAAAALGLCGGSIEDTSGDETRPIYDFSLAVERVAAAVGSRAVLVRAVRADGAGRRISCTGARTSTIPSAACRRSRRPGRRCSTRPVSPASRTSAPCAPALRGRSTSLRGWPAVPSRWHNWPRRA